MPTWVVCWDWSHSHSSAGVARTCAWGTYHVYALRRNLQAADAHVRCLDASCVCLRCVVCVCVRADAKAEYTLPVCAW